MARRGALASGLGTALIASLGASALAAGAGRQAVSMAAVPLGVVSAAGWLWALRRGRLLPRRADHLSSAALALGAWALAQALLYHAATVAPSPRAGALLERLDALRSEVEGHQEWAKGLPERQAAARRMAAQAGAAGSDGIGEARVLVGGAFRAQVRAQFEGIAAEAREHDASYRAAVSSYNAAAVELEALGIKRVLRYHPPGEPLREFRRRRGEPGWGFLDFLRETSQLRGLRGWGLGLEAAAFAVGGALPGLLFAGLAGGLLLRCPGCGTALRVPERKGRVTVRCPRCKRTETVG